MGRRFPRGPHSVPSRYRIQHRAGGIPSRGRNSPRSCPTWQPATKDRARNRLRTGLSRPTEPRLFRRYRDLLQHLRPPANERGWGSLLSTGPRPGKDRDSDDLGQWHVRLNVWRGSVGGLESFRPLDLEPRLCVSRNASAHLRLEHRYGFDIGHPRSESPAPGAAPLARRIKTGHLLGHEPVLCRSAASPADPILCAAGHAITLALRRTDRIQPGRPKSTRGPPPGVQRHLHNRKRFASKAKCVRADDVALLNNANGRLKQTHYPVNGTTGKVR